MAAAEFHDETGPPVQSFVVDMNPDFKEQSSAKF